jgi:Tfp pilus assembly protein PilF
MQARAGLLALFGANTVEGSALCYLGRVAPSLRLLVLPGLAALFLGACGTAPPITKLVGGRQITTRSIDPEAYEHVTRALLYEEQDRVDDALDELRRAVMLDHDAPELHAHMAELLLRLGKEKEAAAEVRGSLKIATTAQGLLAMAHLRDAQGDTAGMVTALERARHEVEFQAGDDEAETVYLELAEAQLRALDLPAARTTLETLTAAEPESGAGHMRLTAIYWAQGEMAKAKAQLHKALAEEPNQIEALVALAWIYAAAGRDGDTRRAFHEALDRSENALEIAAAFARYLVGIGDTQAAEQLADDLSVPDGSLDADTIGGRIELERSAHRLDRALHLVMRAEELGLSEEAKNRLELSRAALLKEQGKSQAATAALLALGKDAPLFFEARLRAAERLRDAGKLADATRTVEEAASAAKGDRDTIAIEAAVSLSLIDEKRGDPAAGIARLSKLLESRPGESRLVMSLAAIEERRGSWMPALTIVERYLAKHPGAVEALNFWGFVAADHDHALELASKRLQVANAFDPGSGGLIDSLGWVSFRKKDLAKASMFLEQAARLEPADPEVQWHLGEVHAARKDDQRALAAYRRALGFKPDQRLRKRIEASLARLNGGKVSGP